MLRAILIALVFAVLFCFFRNTKENYGGKVKKIRKIPFNEGARICATYYESCVRESRGEDAGFCYKRFGPGGTCESELYYSNYHRM